MRGSQSDEARTRKIIAFIIALLAAEFVHTRAKEGHIPYDFEMDYKDHSKLFCSEVASAAYERFGIQLWTAISLTECETRPSCKA